MERVGELILSPERAEAHRETQPRVESRHWWHFVLDVQKKYRDWRKELVARTDVALGSVADSYLEQRERQRDKETGETPANILHRALAGIDAARSTLTRHSALDLGIRAALSPIEFGSQMAMKQVGIDIAVRQAELASTISQRGGREAVTELKKQAMEFADEARLQFEALAQAQQELIPTAFGDTQDEVRRKKEEFRRQKIEQGRAYAEQLLREKAPNLDEESRSKILQDIESYLDTVVFDSQRPSLLKKWESLTNSHRRALDGIIKKHIDVFQREKARNLSVALFLARNLTLGGASYLALRAVAAKEALSRNYTTELRRVAGEDRDLIARMQAFGRGVAEGIVQLSGFDKYRSLREQESEIDALAERLGDQDIASIQDALWLKYEQKLKKRNLDRNWLNLQIEQAMQATGDRRRALSEMLKHKIEQTHRAYLQTAARQAEHIYQQYTVNVSAVSMLFHVDAAYERVLQGREQIGMILEQMSNDQIGREAATVDIEIGTAIPDPQMMIIENVVPGLQAEIDDTVSSNSFSLIPAAEAAPATAFVDDVSAVAEAEFDEHAECELIVSEMMPNIPVVNKDYTIVAGDSLWGLAHSHLDAYRARSGDNTLTENDIVQQIRHDNNITGDLIIAGTTLHLAELDLSTEVMKEQEVYDIEKLNSEAEAADDREYAPGYLKGVGREQLDNLPPGEYLVALGERFSDRTGNRTPINYDSYVKITVAENAEPIVQMLSANGLAIGQPQCLMDFMEEDHHPVVRVFSESGEPQEMQPEELQPEKWSERSRSAIAFLRDNPINVLEKQGFFCSGHIAGVLDTLGVDLSDDLGIGVRNAKGEETGVVVNAPMIGAGIESAGGLQVASLENYFSLSAAGSRPLERLDSDNEGYRAAVGHWIRAAADSPLQIGTFLYDRTKIQNIIAANQENGGEANSHGALLLGEKDLEGEVVSETTVADFLADSFGVSKGDMKERGWMFGVLGIEVNGQPITDQADWQNMALQPGDQVVVHDVAINHLYHGARVDTLVQLLVTDGHLTPVSVYQPNPEAVNEALAESAGDFPVDTYAQVTAGDTMSAILERSHVPRDLWMASIYTMRHEGLNPDHIEPRQLIPIYCEDDLRANLESIYAEEEEMLRINEDNPSLHLVRPNETMDDIVGNYFQRADHSAEEWQHIKDSFASRLNIESRVVNMPGDQYTPPYRLLEYELVADSALAVSGNFLEGLSQEISRQRALERVYLPETIPIMDEDGHSEVTELPEEVRGLIDRTVDQHPEYHESLKSALTLVFANEQLRQDEYYIFGSRALQKDIAWAVQDNTVTRELLNAAIFISDRCHLTAVSDTLERAANVSSAGLFQVRANNFVDEHGQYNYSPILTGENLGFQEFEDRLREDPRFNTEAAAYLLHQNAVSLETYYQAFGDPHANDEEEKTIAVVNSYNGGPFKTMLGGFQESLLRLGDSIPGVQLPLDRASGRDVENTQTAFIAICTSLAEQGKIDLTPEQIDNDAKLLGDHTIAFLRSDSTQALKAYCEETGVLFTLLPQEKELGETHVTYGNYALLAVRGGALNMIEHHSKTVRQQRGDVEYYARSEAPVQTKGII